MRPDDYLERPANLPPIESRPREMNQKSIVVFDGVCNLCNETVIFIIRRDPNNRFCFASFQSTAGKRLVRTHHLSVHMESVVLIKGEKAYSKSGAILRIALSLTGFWPCLSVFLLVPPFIRDRVYDLIANNRYRWFGRKDQCLIPTPELLNRFLES